MPAAELSNVFVVCMGIGVVFVGLVALIIICKIMGAICGALVKDQPAATAAPAAAPAAPAPVSNEIPNRQEFVAAVAAAIAEDMGTDISRIRIHSIVRK